MIRDWILGIGGSDNDAVSISLLKGTIEEVKEYVKKEMYEEASIDLEPEELEDDFLGVHFCNREDKDGFYSYIQFSDSHEDWEVVALDKVCTINVSEKNN